MLSVILNEMWVQHIARNAPASMFFRVLNEQTNARTHARTQAHTNEWINKAVP